MKTSITRCYLAIAIIAFCLMDGPWWARACGAALVPFSVGMAAFTVWCFADMAHHFIKYVLFYDFFNRR